VTYAHVGFLPAYDNTVNCVLRVARSNHRPFAFRSNQVGPKFPFASILVTRISRSHTRYHHILEYKDRLSRLPIGLIIIFWIMVLIQEESHKLMNDTAF